MSSIDKYVESTAKGLDSRVSVQNCGGQLVGKINGKVVFSIADRYGFLSPDESRIINTSIQQFHAEERQRLEQARIAKRTELQNTIANKIKDLEAGKASVQRDTNDLMGEISAALNATRSDFVDLSSFAQKLDPVLSKIDKLSKDSQAQYDVAISRLRSIVVSDNDSVAAYQAQLARVNALNFQIGFHVSQNERGQLSQIKTTLDKIQGRLPQIKQKVASLQKNGVNYRVDVKISSIDDLDALESEIDAICTEMRKVQADKEANECIKAIEQINRKLRQKELQSYGGSQNSYTVISYEDEIAEELPKVRRAYNKLKDNRETRFSTCDSETIATVEAFLDEIEHTHPSDETTYNRLKTLLNDYDKYVSDDELHSADFAKYQQKVEELKRGGIAECEIEAFNPRTYTSEQSARLGKQLLECDYKNSAAKALNNVTIAIDHFKNKGWELLKLDTGLDSENSEDSLACEALFVIPGCNGVIVQVIADENGIRKKMLGIQRNGTSTSAERVLEVSRILDRDGDGFDDAERLSYFGTIPLAVDSGVENVIAYIQKNGAYRLSKEELAVYDSIVSSGDTSKWKTRVETRQHTQLSDCGREREIRSHAIAAHYQARRK